MGLVIVSSSFGRNEMLTSLTKNSVVKLVDYAQDWERFKQAAKTKNPSDLAELCTNQITDFEGLSFLLTELYILRALDETPYDKLQKIELEGKSYLQFYAEESGLDNEGYAFRTSVTLLFLATDKGLLLDQYFAVG